LDKNDPHTEEELRFFATAPKSCSYLKGRNAISVFADPEARLSPVIYNQLARYGFRRSGNDLYVPACPGCSECIPVRILAKQFRRSRNQQKIWNRNRDLACNVLPPEYRDSHFELYTRYLKSRHPGGGMDDPTPDDYMRFLGSDWCDTLFIEFNSMGYRCKFLNAFRPIFFTTPELFINISLSATTEMNRAAQLPFLNFVDLKKRHALYHDYSNKSLIDKGFDVPYYTPADAAAIMAEMSQDCDLLLYEYFLTDYAGHAQDMTQAIAEIHKVEKLIYALLALVNLKNTTVMVISDHGNVEDLRTKSHTLNPAFMALWGSNRNSGFSSILDVYPFLIDQVKRY